MTRHTLLSLLCIALPLTLAATTTNPTLPPKPLQEEVVSETLTCEELLDAFLDHETVLITFFKDALNEVGDIVLPSLAELQKTEKHNATVRQHSSDFIALWDQVDKVKLDGSNESLAALGVVFTKAIDYVDGLMAHKDGKDDDALVRRLNSQQNFAEVVKKLKERLLRLCDDFVARLVNVAPNLEEADRKFVNSFLKTYNEAKSKETKWHDMAKLLKVFLVEKERILN